MAVDLSRRAKRCLDVLQPVLRDRIMMRLRSLAAEPVPHDAKFLGRDVGERCFRIRIGDYRALYTLDNEGNVLVINVAKRSRAYD